MTSIALIGMPGSGKTSVGRLLARRLDCDWVDCDHALEERIGCSIRAFFEQQGEAAFRDIETQVLADLLAQERRQVLSTGGGVVLREANRALLQQRAHTVYLRVGVQALWRRLRTDTQRPLLQVADPRQRLTDLFTVRDPLYTQTAAHTMETGGMSSHQAAHLLAAQLELQPPARLV
ncbi:shikimate kinase [Amphibiibacter pelophylacis]|uniref:Shikimate kinase n=1 Tax=Amphibiibacter pelophylacis TaxID=1799477 RepID=A0ACC6P496_9BURK